MCRLGMTLASFSACYKVSQPSYTYKLLQNEKKHPEGCYVCETSGAYRESGILPARRYWNRFRKTEHIRGE